MAMAAWSCSNQSPASLFPYPSNFYTKPLIHYHPLAILYCPKNGSFLDASYALAIERANEVLRIEAKSLVFETNIEEESSNKIEIINEKIELALRRKKRRKRRRCYSECLDMDKGDKISISKPVKTGLYLTLKEESEYSWYLKEEARMETLRKRVEETSEIEVNPNQLAKAAGMSRRRLDKVLINAKISQKKIIKCYTGLVVSVAASYQGKGLSLQDLIQEGSIGLLHGAKKFNPNKGYKLSTYAYWWIRQAITRAIANKSRVIRLPGSISELVPKICNANTELSRKLQRMPSYDEIAEALDMDVSTVRLVIERNRAPISIDQIVTSQGYMSLQDIISGPEDILPEEILKRQMMKQDLEKLLHNVLCDREAKILKLHFGLNGDTPQSFEEIGKVLKLSRERIRQINCTALSKLRESSMLDSFKMYIT
ncbi:RNA polymerase sigma factor sigD, chloroplastic [Nicotiana tabacum]|uniref:RNA polymerase sigma factor sigD, chloroplastic n=2 Tax=Nicotiana TaxID=4085 RepID=A0A1S4DJ14_TOBAC|nr:PREDICTED: RNA polymerase sigma factor sigD, chloroplastic [Nicotiana sylvestris]XP_016513390.1 PREDICTED: RNA polymerase sigma factor sigD, chloroplastic-like [Nicotiana tabacum]